jgi:hypothetical protein
MKFKEGNSVFGKLLNKDYIFRDLRNMQDIMKIKLRMSSRETSGTNIFDGEPLTFTNADLIQAHVVINFDVQVVQIRGQMVSSSRVGVPIPIRATGEGREICMCLRRRFTRVGLIEPIVAIQGNVSKAVANLTYWTIGLRAIGREAMARVLGRSMSPATKQPGGFR